MLVLIISVVSLALVILGVLIKYHGKYDLILGYKNLLPHEKKKVDVKGLSSFVGSCLFALAGILLAGAFVDQFIYFGGSQVTLYLFVSVVVYMVMSNQKFYKKYKEEEVKNIESSALKTSIAIFIVGIFIMVFTYFLEV